MHRSNKATPTSSHTCIAMFPGWPIASRMLYKSSVGAREHDWVLLNTKLSLHSMVQYWTDLFMQDICEEYDCLELHWTAPLLVTSSQSFEPLASLNKHLKGNNSTSILKTDGYCCLLNACINWCVYTCFEGDKGIDIVCQLVRHNNRWFSSSG